MAVATSVPVIYQMSVGWRHQSREDKKLRIDVDSDEEDPDSQDDSDTDGIKSTTETLVLLDRIMQLKHLCGYTSFQISPDWWWAEMMMRKSNTLFRQTKKYKVKSKPDYDSFFCMLFFIFVTSIQIHDYFFISNWLISNCTEILPKIKQLKYAQY